MAREEILIEINQQDNTEIEKTVEDIGFLEGELGNIEGTFEDVTDALNELGVEALDGKEQFRDIAENEFLTSEKSEQLKKQVLGLADAYGKANKSGLKLNDVNEEMVSLFEDNENASINIRESMNDYKDNVHAATTENKKLAKASQVLGQDMASTQQTLSKAGKSLVETEEGIIKVRDELTGSTRDLASGMEEARVKSQDFQSELLSAMFFFMQLEKTMGGFLEQSFKAAGVYDLLGNIFKFLFLPVAMEVQSALIDIAEFVFNMSDATREFIGRAVFLTFVFSKAARFASIFAIGMQGVKQALLAVGASTKGLGKAFRWLKAGRTGAFLSSLAGGFSSLASAIGVSSSVLAGFLAIIPLVLSKLGWLDDVIWGIIESVKFLVRAFVTGIKLLGKIIGMADDWLNLTDQIQKGFADAGVDFDFGMSGSGAAETAASAVGMEADAGTIADLQGDFQKGNQVINQVLNFNGDSPDAKRVGYEASTQMGQMLKSKQGTRFG